MITIRPILPHEIPLAKELIYQVAHRVFADPRPLEEAIAFFEAQGLLKDMDDLEHVYTGNQGIFLVMTEDDRLVGTGAVRRIDGTHCELKRLWLRFEYHGQGMGYRMITELLTFARQSGYRRIRLETDRVAQGRAYALYRRLGFYDIPAYGTNPHDAAMEMVL